MAQDKATNNALTLSSGNKSRVSFERRSTAWLIPYTRQQYIAMSLATCQELVEQPKAISVPGCAPHAVGLLPWHREWLALIDFDCLLNNTASPPQPTLSYALVVAYHDKAGQVAYGALSLAQLPTMITVQEKDFCPLPSDNPRWPEFAVSCFQYQEQAVPIIDPTQIFNRSYGLLS